MLSFLIVAAYHFGKEDTVFIFKKKFLISEILFFLKGSSVIVAPLLFQRDATNEIYKFLDNLTKIWRGNIFPNKRL